MARRLGLAILIVVVSCVATGAPAPAAAPAAGEFEANLMQYNVCGSVCSDSQAQRSMDYAAWFFNALPAASLSLNELCFQDFQALVTNLGVDGRFVESKASASGCPGADKRFGNALLFRGTLQSAQSLYFPTQETTPCNQNNVECRTLLCLKTTSPAGGDVGQCSSHLENNIAFAPAQANEYLWIAVSWLGDRPHHWLAGDLNLSPTQVPAGFGQGYVDLVVGNTHNATSPSRHIDYLWLRKPTTPETSSPFCPADASDHCVAFGAGHW